MSDPPDVVIVGDVMVDVAVRGEELARGGDVHGEVRVRPGGSAANAAVWAASEGARVRIHGRAGKDLAGRLLIESLSARGVDPAIVAAPRGRTGALLAVLEAGERSMLADRGANAGLSPGDLPDRLRASVILVSGYLLLHKGSRAGGCAALERAEADRYVAVDAASWPLLHDHNGARFLEDTRRATLLFANGLEVEALTGSKAEPGARDLARSYAMVVVKLGADGALLVRGDRLERVPAREIVEADPTGAGDALAGTMLARLAAGDDPLDALRAGCEAGTVCAASEETWPG